MWKNVNVCSNNVGNKWRNQNYPNISAFNYIKKTPVVFTSIKRVYLQPTNIIVTDVLPPENSLWVDNAIWNDILLWIDGGSAISYIPSISSIWNDTFEWNNNLPWEDGYNFVLPPNNAWTDIIKWNNTLIWKDL